MDSVKIAQARIMADGNDDCELEILEEMEDYERECENKVKIKWYEDD